MERYLSYCLDEEGTKSLTLFRMQDYEVDIFTSTNFANSDEVKQYFEFQINKYREQNQAYIAAQKKKWAGIAVLQPLNVHDLLVYDKVKTLYRDDLEVWPLLLNYEGVYEKLLVVDQIKSSKYGRFIPLTSDLAKSVIYVKPTDITMYQRRIDKTIEWVTTDEKTMYEKIRLIISAYSKLREEQKMNNKRYNSPITMPTLDSLTKNVSSKSNDKVLIKALPGMSIEEDQNDFTFYRPDIDRDEYLPDLREAKEMGVAMDGNGTNNKAIY